MTKNENIFVKLQIEKSQSSGDLMLNIQFDKSAPNFSSDKNEICWSPTLEEIDFIEETFEMISNRKCRTSWESKTTADTQQNTPPLESDSQNSTPTTKEEEPEQESPPSPSETTEDKHKMFVEANEEAIDEVIKRRTGDVDDGLIVEADEKTIIEKVLKQKKRKK
jgi:hypothetical protein